MFLKPAQLESTRPAIQICDEDLGYKTNETAAEPGEENIKEAEAKKCEEFENWNAERLLEEILRYSAVGSMDFQVHTFLDVEKLIQKKL